MLNFWRAPTDNDHGGEDKSNERVWRIAGLDRMEQKTNKVTVKQLNDKQISIKVDAFIVAPGNANGFNALISYTICGSGDILIEADIDPVGDMPILPKIGLQMTVAGDYDRFTWLGRGPHENYPDRKESALVGLYNSNVQDQYFPYVMPQENGAKSDVRWAALTNQKGEGLLTQAMPLLTVSALHYNTKDLELAKHTYDLKQRDDITLNLDFEMLGLGGDDSWTPMTVHPKYRVHPKKAQYSVRIRPCTLDASSPKLVNKNVFKQ